ncbi:MAG: hypothetical protein ACKOZT_09685 [Cyanobium sp.]
MMKSKTDICSTRNSTCCVISLATGRNTYLQAIKRLEASLRKVGFQGDFLGWIDQYPEGSPSQLEAPMAFKTHCFLAAKRLGYRHVLWIDAPVVALRPLGPIFAMIEKNSYVTFTNNYEQMLGQWCSDVVLDHHGISRDEALQIPETPTSVLGLDLDSQLGQEFLARWHAICSDGLTCRGRKEPYQSAVDHDAVAWNKNQCISKDPRVGGHRHDQTAAGIVCHRLGLRPYADNLRDVHYPKKPIDRSTILLHYREYGETITRLDKIYFDAFYAPFIPRPRLIASRAWQRMQRLAPTTDQP